MMIQTPQKRPYSVADRQIRVLYKHCKNCECCPISILRMTINVEVSWASQSPWTPPPAWLNMHMKCSALYEHVQKNHRNLFQDPSAKMINWKIADPKSFAPFPGSNCTHLRVFKDPSLAHVDTRTPVHVTWVFAYVHIWSMYTYVSQWQWWCNSYWTVYVCCIVQLQYKNSQIQFHSNKQDHHSVEISGEKIICLAFFLLKYLEIVKWCFFFNNNSQSVTHRVSDYITSRTVLKSSQTWGVARTLFYEGRNASLQQIRLAKAKSAKIIHAWMGEGGQLPNEPFDFWLPLLPLGLGRNPPSVTFC